MISSDCAHHALDVRDPDARTSAEALTLDTVHAARNLALDPAVLEAVLGVDRATIERLLACEQRVCPDTEVGRRALMLVRLHRYLGETHGAIDRVQHWLDRVEAALGATPRELMHSFDGLGHLLAYVQARCIDHRPAMMLEPPAMAHVDHGVAAGQHG